jgi:hypothetical protein
MNTQRKRMTIVALGAVAAGLMVLPGSGGAKGPAPDCVMHQLCVWGDADFTGQLVTLKRPGISNKLSKQMDDTASSVKNRRGTVAYLYADTDGGGESYCVEPHQKVNFLITFNDTASSTKLTKTKKHCPV